MDWEYFGFADLFLGGTCYELVYDSLRRNFVQQLFKKVLKYSVIIDSKILQAREYLRENVAGFGVFLARVSGEPTGLVLCKGGNGVHGLEQCQEKLWRQVV